MMKHTVLASSNAVCVGYAVSVISNPQQERHYTRANTREILTYPHDELRKYLSWCEDYVFDVLTPT